MNIEIEIKARTKDFDGIKKALEKMRANFARSEKQIDKIFGTSKFLDSENKIIEGGIVARIREVDKKRTLDFKEILRQKGGIELIYEISNIELAEKFLNKLDFKEAFTIKKTREIFSYQDFTICLDDVEQLGKFIEVEKIISNEEEKNKTKQECFELLKKLAPDSEIEEKKYGDLIQELINKKRRA
ncbi:MAG: class IV adenylate cyclase [Minisyncoccales bacterium]